MEQTIEEEDDDWTFATADTQYMTHGLHPYPARMIPQVARKLLNMFTTDDKEDICIDPYCGSGTVLVESKLKGIKSIGIDINPLAILIAKVKTTPIETRVLSSYARELLTQIHSDIESGIIVESPKIKNLDFWFKPQVIRILSIIRRRIFDLETKNKDVFDFFRVCFSLTVRKSSNIRNGEYKLYRYSKDELERYNPDVFKIFKEIVQNNIAKMRSFVEVVDKAVPTYIYKGDTRQLLSIDPNVIHEGCATILITSPPYGDAHTTVAYGQFSRYSALWLGFDEKEVLEIDDLSLGGRVINKEKDLESPTLNLILNEIRKRDESRAKEVYAFFYDVDLCMEQISKVMKQNKSHIAFVVGNRTVRRVKIPCDEILIELGKKYGLKHIATKHRDIPTKTIPWVNAPENVPMLKGETMHKENIIIWEF
ncbi:hypothetical protein HRbin04_00598 [archaeon HR04]|nr:hypothetical protein HRbin04_00598 [archaeon HR04]